MKIVKEFKEFAMKGNVIDLAVGVIIGGAFGKIVTSLVNDMIMPPIGRLIGGIDFKDLTIPLYTKEGEAVFKVANPDAVVPSIAYGQFINVMIDFLIVAFCIFMLVKVINILRRNEKKEVAPVEATEKECPYCLSNVPIKATRCKHCTSQLEATARG
ncbi:mechanosensitive ion channel protein MscL [Paenibacillus sp. FSL H8-0548]|uniref:large-conductance mechanosensitive channel protein MscL n=1 Tax=Paenibacillus sp. FSL H8-0548 TaxID=1920422 RepID=UPI00096D15BD|nr:large-conductance mechanosensitive channel protein MscL [Paenibacillus sp. FSL H8-0548]OMF32644.1 mechanosensitive ion channel protein MscL [Paenibacillus sp. FSL H8-0548]